MNPYLSWTNVNAYVTHLQGHQAVKLISRQIFCCLYSQILTHMRKVKDLAFEKPKANV